MTESPTPGSGLRLAPPGARFMNVVRWVLFAGLLLLAAVSLASWIAWKRGEGAATATASLYHCPMHPSYTSPRPADCPICGMDLVPVPDHAHGGADGDVPGLAGVTVDAERVQRIGVRVAVAERAPLEGDLELAAFVTPDESRLHAVQLRVTGWIRTLHVARTGQTVRAGDPLVTLYSPELFQSENEYVVALESGVAPAAARERLRLLGVPDDELVRLERDRTPHTDLALRSPVSGTVLELRVAEGQSVGPDTPLMVLGDLSRPWLLADVYELDLPRVRVGDPVRFTSDALPGRAWNGRVEFLYPTVSSDTRTLRARVALQGDLRDLRPGLFGRAVVRGHGAPVLQVPLEAVIRAGDETYVFLARAGGRFEPRRVTPGRESGERVEILRGIAAGDTVVASASFLIDSESRLRAAIAGLGGARTGAAGDSAGAPAGHAH